MATEKKDMYLGSRGRVFGPFDASEIKRMRSTGEIYRYHFLWEPKTGDWRPVDSPPPDPVEQEKRRVESNRRSIEAVCHDSFSSMVAGTLRNISDEGCDLVADDPSESPRLGLAAPVRMEFLDPASRRSVQVKVRTCHVSREQGRWVYQVAWDVRPPQL